LGAYSQYGLHFIPKSLGRNHSVNHFQDLKANFSFLKVIAHKVTFKAANNGLEDYRLWLGKKTVLVTGATNKAMAKLLRNLPHGMAVKIAGSAMKSATTKPGTDHG